MESQMALAQPSGPGSSRWETTWTSSYFSQSVELTSRPRPATSTPTVHFQNTVIGGNRMTLAEDTDTVARGEETSGDRRALEEPAPENAHITGGIHNNGADLVLYPAVAGLVTALEWRNFLKGEVLASLELYSLMERWLESVGVTAPGTSAARIAESLAEAEKAARTEQEAEDEAGAEEATRAEQERNRSDGENSRGFVGGSGHASVGRRAEALRGGKGGGDRGGRMIRGSLSGAARDSNLGAEGERPRRSGRATIPTLKRRAT